VVRDAVAAALFRLVERLVRLIDQFGGGGRADGERRHAEARRHRTQRPFAAFDRLAQPLRYLTAALRVRARQQDHELLAAVARYEVFLARLGPKDVRDFAQNLVTRRMAVGVIVHLELVDVQHDDGDRHAPPRGEGKLLLQDLAEVAMVFQSGQSVGGYELGQPLVSIRQLAALAFQFYV